ncbi:MAG TPA: AMP-binding protein [Dermatophilaceae bacterium]
MDVRYYPTRRLRDLRELVQRSADEFGDRTAFKELDRSDEVRSYSFSQLRDDVAALGTALLAQGVAGRHVALVGESCYSYVVSYLAVVNAGAVIVPLDRELTVDELVHLVKKSDADLLLYGDSLADDVPAIRDACPRLTGAVAIDLYSADTDEPDDPGVPDLLRTGRELLAQGDTSFASVAIDPDAICAILFTSGTTGANKGVMLTPRNITAVVHGAYSLHRLRPVSLSVLPINHSYEFNLHVLGAIFGGITLCFNDSVKHVRENLGRFGPEMTLMVPMIVEALFKNIWREAEKNHLATHLRYGIWLSNALRRIGIDLRRYYFIPVIQSLGGKLNMIVCGGAPLRPEVVKGMSDLGIEVYNGYGITECSPLISSNCALANIPGSVGIPIPGIRVRIDSPDADGNGEIQVKGDNVMVGYYKDADATARSFTPDGWFKTGDLGHLGRRNALFITGRQKNLIILPNGKNVQPEELEEHLLSSIEYVKEVVVHASTDEAGVEHIVATAFLDAMFVQGVGPDEAEARFRADVARHNRKLAGYKQIHHAQVRDCEFTKTSTQKIKRYEAQGAMS